MPFSGLPQHMTIYNVVRNNLRPQFIPSSVANVDVGLQEKIPDIVYRNIAIQCWSADPNERLSLCTVIDGLNSILE